MDEMLAFAYAECGLTVDEFFKLSFYEWSLEIYKVRKKQERVKDKWESDAAFVRELLAMLYNPHRGNGPQKSGKDFIKLSFDKKETETVEPLTEKAMKERLGTKFRKDG